jgi:hypothetical protein
MLCAWWRNSLVIDNAPFAPVGQGKFFALDGAVGQKIPNEPNLVSIALINKGLMDSKRSHSDPGSGTLGSFCNFAAWRFGRAG